MAELMDAHACFADAPPFRSRLAKAETFTANFEDCVKSLSRSARSVVDTGYCARYIMCLVFANDYSLISTQPHYHWHRITSPLTSLMLTIPT